MQNNNEEGIYNSRINYLNGKWKDVNLANGGVPVKAFYIKLYGIEYEFWEYACDMTWEWMCENDEHVYIISAHSWAQSYLNEHLR